MKYILVVSFFILLACEKQESLTEDDVKSSFDILDTLIGGGLVLLTGILSQSVPFFKYRKENKYNRKRKNLLKQMLEDKKVAKEGCRKLSTLSRTIGTSEERCRELLIEIDARGLLIYDEELGRYVEGWALIKNKPLDKEQ